MRARLAGMTLILVALVATAACTIVTAPPATAPAPPPPPPPAPGYGYDVGLFYDDLDAYGSWFEMAPYGYVWAPAGVGRDWRPYTVGRWVYSDYGWTWVSDEDFGWAVFHYGRWVHARRYGWVWVPGTTWGPAWVAWRSGGGYSGWAPLPPEARWRAGVGLDLGGADLDVVITSDAWCFVADPYIFEPRVVVRVEPVVQNVTVVKITRNVTHYTVVEKRVVNRGLDIDRVQKVVKQPVPRPRVVAADRPVPPGRKYDAGRDEVHVYRPDVEDRRPERKPRVSAPPPEPGAPAAPKPAGPPPPRATSPEPGSPVPPKGGPAAPHASSVEHRQALERQRLDQRQEAERKNLEERQAAERKNPPKEVSKEALAKRQTDERQHLDQRQQRERKDAEERHAREKKNPPPDEKEPTDQGSEGNGQSE